jgi:hypothetical protein
LSARVTLAALVVPALVLVAMTARSYQPFGDDDTAGQRAPSTTFIDGAFTVIGVLCVVSLVVFLWVWLWVRPRSGRGRSSSGLSGLALFLIVITAIVGVRQTLGFERQQAPIEGVDPGFPQQLPPGQPVEEVELARAPEVIWPLAIGLAVLIVAVVATVIVLARRRSRPSERTAEELEQLVRALDEAIDDLRREPDLRRAVVAAYARMEQALSYHGFPRRLSETPYEYLARVARELDAEEPVAELTALFEEAKFSEHSVGEAMRVRAIDALTAVRREVLTAST